MSIFGLLPAARNRLRTQLGLKPEECRVRPGPKPPPVCGDRFVSLFGLSWTPGDPDLNQGLDEFFGISVCVTIRCAWLGSDDVGEEAYIKAGLGIEQLVRRINVCLHQSIDLMNDANKIIGYYDTTNNCPSAGGIIEYLRWEGADSQPTEVGGDWFGAIANDPDDEGSDLMGLTMQTNFGRARRVQTLSGAT